MKLVLYSLVRSENVHALMNVTEEGEGGGGGGRAMMKMMGWHSSTLMDPDFGGRGSRSGGRILCEVVGQNTTHCAVSTSLQSTNGQ